MALEVQGMTSCIPEVRIFSGEALGACEGLIHPRCPPAWPSPVAAQQPVQNCKAVASTDYLGVPRMWSPSAAYTGELRLALMHNASSMFMRGQIIYVCRHHREWPLGGWSVMVKGSLLDVFKHGEDLLYPAPGGDEEAGAQMQIRGPPRSSTAIAIAQTAQMMLDHPGASVQQIEPAAVHSRSGTEMLPEASSTYKMPGHATSMQPVSSTGITSMPASVRAVLHSLEHSADHAQPAAGGKTVLAGQANGTARLELHRDILAVLERPASHGGIMEQV